MKKLAAAIAAGLFLTGCYYDNMDEVYPGAGLFTPCDTTSVMSYSTHITSIIDNNCINCHQGNSPSGNVSLEGWQNVHDAGISGILVDVVYHNSGSAPMPPNYQLDSCQMKQIQKWVDAGSPNN